MADAQRALAATARSSELESAMAAARSLGEIEVLPSSAVAVEPIGDDWRSRSQADLEGSMIGEAFADVLQQQLPLQAPESVAVSATGVKRSIGTANGSCRTCKQRVCRNTAKCMAALLPQGPAVENRDGSSPGKSCKVCKQQPCRRGPGCSEEDRSPRKRTVRHSSANSEEKSCRSCKQRPCRGGPKCVLFQAQQATVSAIPVLSAPYAGASRPTGGLLHDRLCSILRPHAEVFGGYLEKDLAKAVGATSLIGEGRPGSATARYIRAAGELANLPGPYTAFNRVFVSANGNHPQRVPVLDAAGALHGAYHLLELVASAGATVVADIAAVREDAYNVGERELVSWLLRRGYHEQPAHSGVWVPVAVIASSATSAASVADVAGALSLPTAVATAVETAVETAVATAVATEVETAVATPPPAPKPLASPPPVPRLARREDLPGLRALFEQNECLRVLGAAEGRHDLVTIGEVLHAASNPWSLLAVAKLVACDKPSRSLCSLLFGACPLLQLASRKLLPRLLVPLKADASAPRASQAYVSGVIRGEYASWEACAAKYAAPSALWVITEGPDESSKVVGSIGALVDKVSTTQRRLKTQLGIGRTRCSVLLTVAALCLPYALCSE